MPSYRDLLKQAKDSVRQVDGAEADEAASSPARWCSTSVSPRSTSRALPNAPHPAGQPREPHRESGDRQGHPHRVLRCREPVGVRRPHARRARLLRCGVGCRWLQQVEGRGRDWKTPRCSPPSSATGTPATRCSPRSARRGSSSCWVAGSCCSAPAASAPLAGLYLAAAGVGTLGVVDMDVVDESNLQRQILHNTDRIGAEGRLGQEDAHRPEPGRQRGHPRRPPGRRQRGRHPVGLRRRGRRGGQLPRAVPTQRRLAEDRRARRPRLDLPVRGPGPVFKPYEGPCYRCPSPSRRRPSWRPPAPRPACWACCPGSSAPSRRWRR